MVSCAVIRKGKCLAKAQTHKKTNIAAKVAGVVCASLVAVGCVGFSLAFAGGGLSSGGFGLGKISQAVVVEQSESVEGAGSTSFVASGLVIESTAQRDISRGIEEIAAEEEAARIAAEKARIAAEKAAIERANTAIANQIAREGSLVISPVDFSIGREAFIAHWTERLDKYLAGSNLAGYGKTFATAAWENGVDPRWSPAISNTESSKGANCFKWHNAWGWGQSSWSSWEQAINAHVAGLAKGYGYTISLNNAAKYCPPTYEQWYADTLSEMRRI
ncbi:MAG: CMP-2-keto-3-deoxyoctulosonic acid synthetase [Eggerthellaceae bacterium]|nr:CMP-2-keto-3-deoxyoctulosonic acid synthetase [Eggerthellaceae bacterium]